MFALPLVFTAVLVLLGIISAGPGLLTMTIDGLTISDSPNPLSVFLGPASELPTLGSSNNVDLLAPSFAFNGSEPHNADSVSSASQEVLALCPPLDGSRQDAVKVWVALMIGFVTSCVPAVATLTLINTLASPARSMRKSQRVCRHVPGRPLCDSPSSTNQLRYRRECREVSIRGSTTRLRTPEGAGSLSIGTIAPELRNQITLYSPQVFNLSHYGPTGAQDSISIGGALVEGSMSTYSALTSLHLLAQALVLYVRPTIACTVLWQHVSHLGSPNTTQAVVGSRAPRPIEFPSRQDVFCSSRKRSRYCVRGGNLVKTRKTRAIIVCKQLLEVLPFYLDDGF